MGIIRDAIIALMQDDRDVSTALKMIGLDGGAGSGNFGHSGRPGLRGGSAKRGGGGGVSKERSKEIKAERTAFKKLSRDDKIKALKNVGQIPVVWSKFDEDVVKDYADRHGMTVDKYLDWRAARWFTMRKFQKEVEHSTPMRPKEVQGKYSYDSKVRFNYIKEHTGCNDEIVSKMKQGLEHHFGSATAGCEWTDKYIDADSRYEGAIYRWKHYSGSKAKKIVAGLFPGAKVENKHETNWSFSSDPWATARFGDYNGHDGSDDEVTIRYTCDRNITGSPVQCLSTFDSGEKEVIPHSKTSWTITDVEKVIMPRGGVMYDVHMVEDDWHAEKGIPVWKPSGSELEGGWKDAFPTEESGASNVFEGIISTKDKEAQNADMNAFMHKVPVGSEFYKVTNDKVLFIRKNDDGWVMADITDKFNDSMKDGLETGIFLNNWTQEDMEIWDKLKNTDMVKPLSKDDAKKELLEYTMMLQLGKQSSVSTGQINNTLKDMKLGKYEGNIEEYFNELPEGTQIHDSINGINWIKNKNNEWDYIDPKTGEVFTTYDASDMKTVAKENPYYDLSVEKTMADYVDEFNKAKAEGDDDWLNNTMKALPAGAVLVNKANGKTLVKKDNGMSFNDGDGLSYHYAVLTEGITSGTWDYELQPEKQKPQPSISEKEQMSHKTVEGMNEKLKNIQDLSISECEMWLDSCPVGTKIIKPGSEYESSFTYKGDSQWEYNNNVLEKPSIMDTEDIAFTFLNPKNKGKFEAVSVPKPEIETVNEPSNHDKFISHETYGGVDNKLQEFHDSGDVDECEDWVEGLKDGTQIEKTTGGYYEKKDGQWKWWYHGTPMSSDAHNVAYNITNSDEFGIKSLPINVPKDNANQADSVLKGIKAYNPEQIKDFAMNAHNGIQIMDVESGFVLKKTKDGWKAIDTNLETNYEPTADWSGYKNVWDIKKADVPDLIKGEGSFVISV